MVDEVPQAVAAAFQIAGDLLDLGTVGAVHLPPGGVGQELGDQALGEAVFSRQQGLLEFSDIAVSLSGGELAAGVDPGVVLVFFSPGANGVKVLESESQGVDVPVAGGAPAALGVGAELLAKSSRAARVDGQGGNVGGGSGFLRPRMFWRTQIPLSTGEVSIPFDVLVSTAPWVRSPPLLGSFSVTFLKSYLSTLSRP